MCVFRNDVIEFGKFQIGSPNAHGRGIGKIATIMTCKMGFILGAKKIDASVHVENLPAKSIYYGVGFEKVGEKPSPAYGMEDVIEITEDDLLKNQIVNEIEYFCLENK
jgi:RimJ/RimL family protein N-acetyltransferase